MIDVVKQIILFTIKTFRAIFSIKIELTPTLNVTFGELLFVFVGVCLLIYYVISLFDKKGE